MTLRCMPARSPKLRQISILMPRPCFQTKPQIALDLLDRARALGMRWGCVVADADYGDNPHCRDGLEQRRLRYVVAVRADFAVQLSGRGQPTHRADVLVATQPARSWRSVSWREGSDGRMRGRFVALRGWRVSPSGRRRAGGLIGEQVAEGKRKYYWSNCRTGGGPGAHGGVCPPA